jgi:hypothetical protein
MRCRSAVAGAVALLLAGAAEATELDRNRERDMVDRDKRAVYELAFDELRRLEPERIRAEDGRVIRRAAELELALANNRRTFFRNDESRCLEGIIPSRDDSCVEFFFVGHPQPRFYLLRAHYYEGSDYRLLDVTSGHVTRLAAEPHFSPNGERVIAVSAAETYDPTGIEIWSTVGPSTALEWKHEAKAYALYSFVRWDGNDSVLLEVKTYVDRELRQVPARLGVGANGWMLRGPVESSQY